MNKSIAVMMSAALMLAGCAPPPPEPDPAVPTAEPLPPEVASMAGPGQDLTTARLLDDGCYWYDHVGPVEQLRCRSRPLTGGRSAARSRPERRAGPRRWPQLSPSTPSAG